MSSIFVTSPFLWTEEQKKYYIYLCYKLDINWEDVIELDYRKTRHSVCA